MSRNTHYHPCAHCGARVVCDGSYEKNFDGWPQVICTFYHLDGGRIARVLCEDCENAECSECGAIAPDAHDDSCPRGPAVEAHDARDDWEPDEIDMKMAQTQYDIER